MQLRTLNNIAQLDTLQDLVTTNISNLEKYEYGANAEALIQDLQDELQKVKRQKRLALGKLAEANFYQIRVKHQVVRDSYINKNLTKLVSFL